MLEHLAIALHIGVAGIGWRDLPYVSQASHLRGEEVLMDELLLPTEILP